MNPELPQHPQKAARLAARLAAVLAIVAGGVTLAGWALDITALKSGLPGWVSVKPNTALGFLLTGLAFLLFALPPWSGNPRLSALGSQLCRLCGWLAGLLGLLTLIEYAYGWNPGLDQWLFREPAGTLGTSHPGRMAPDSALCFLLLAGGLEAARRSLKGKWTSFAASLFGCLVISLAVAAILSYFTPGIGAYGWSGMTIMAVPTAAVFVVLAAAMVLTGWQEGAMLWSFSRWVTGAFAAGLVLLMFLGLTANRSQSYLRETSARLVHAEEALTGITSVLGEVGHAQTHVRGFVITGDERFLKSCQEADRRCLAGLESLAKTLPDTPDQQPRFAQFAAQVRTALQWFHQVAATRRAGPAAVQPSQILHGEELMENLRRLTDQLEKEQRRFIWQINETWESVARFSRLVTFVGTLASLGIFLLALLDLNHSLSERKRTADLLRGSEICYRRLFEAARDGILILNAETGMVVDVNPFMVELLGVTREVFLGKKVWELGFFRDIVANEANFTELQQKGYVRYEDMALEGHDGERHEVEFISNVYLVDHVKVIQCNIRDISERKQSEAELAETKALLQAALDHSQAGIAIADAPSGKLRYVNQAGLLIGGETEAELVAGVAVNQYAASWKLFSLDGTPLAKEEVPLARAVLFGEQCTREFIIRRSEHDDRIVLADAAPIRNPAGEVTAGIVVFLDITEHKRAETALRRQAKRLENMHRTDQAMLLAIESPEAIAETVLSHLRGLLHCSRACVGIFDLEQKRVRLLATDVNQEAAGCLAKEVPMAVFGDLEILRQGRMEIVEDMSAVTMLSPLVQVLGREGIGSSINVPLVTTQGLIGALHVAWVAARAITPDDVDIAGEMASQIAVALEHARLFRETKRNAVELEQRVRDRTAQLEAANKELESFSYSVAHDLRAPLRHISGFASLLREDAGPTLPEQSRHFIEEISGSAAQMGRLIDALLVFSRMGRTDVRPQRLELAELVEETIHQFKFEANGRNILWTKEPLPTVQADPVLLRQVLVNLVSNAVKYTRPRDPARIEVGCASENGQETVIFVRDNGVGFDMQYGEKLFGVFQRLHAEEEFEGTGIGLANVRRIIARHGGRTWAEGKVNEGATFYFSLPTRADGCPGVHPGATAGAPTSVGLDGPGLRASPRQVSGHTKPTEVGAPIGCDSTAVVAPGSALVPALSL